MEQNSASAIIDPTSIKLTRAFIIPAIDLIGGKCVRLTHGDYTQQKIYNEHPLEVAKQFEGAGITRLHVVDLDGAKAGAIQNLKVLETIATNTSCKIDFGGGIKSINDVASVFNAGAAMATIGSLAVKQPAILEEWLMEFGTDKFMIGADVLDEKIKISGWLEDAGVGVFNFIGQMIGLGVQNIFCTDISKDGAMQGPSVGLYQQIIAQHPEIQLIASGGVTSMQDLLQLKQAGCAAAIVGKALYEGTISITEIKSLS